MPKMKSFITKLRFYFVLFFCFLISLFLVDFEILLVMENPVEVSIFFIGYVCFVEWFLRNCVFMIKNCWGSEEK